MITSDAGPYGVGLQVVKQYDYSRTFKSSIDPLTGDVVQGERSRPMQTLIWYPAQPTAQKLAYGDYVHARVTELQFDLSEGRKAQAVAKGEQALSNRLGAEQARAVLTTPMRASLDAQPVAGRFPLVIYAPGAGGAADENADLFEHLASHGYVVVASTSLGTHAKGIDYAMADVETQVRDIQFLLGHALSLPQVDARHIAVIGWSWGGMSNVFAASRDDRISALVSFDGTREPAFTRLIPTQKLTVPWLYISRTPDTIPQINKSEIDTTFSLLNEARYADVHQLTMYPMTHVDFVSRHLRESGEADFGEYSRAEVAQAYNIVSDYVRHFLDATLKNDDKGAAFMRRTPRENGVPPHVMRVDTRQAENLPPSQASMAAELRQRGFAHIGEAYQQARKRDEAFQLSERDLKRWGYGLLDEGRTQDAVEVLKLWATLYPGNWDAADSLAEGYQAAGNKALAIRNFRRSLELNPDNRNAVKQLEVLAADSR
ncbi:MAG TPA: dienelactone hydrolase family protein [Burkholderiaceae bacterium]|nr:dienelactone hydrolase family protein [Burkholderiaceae bacterium]